ncbi:transcriptional regulator [Fulvimarina pelagi HTCC2506]|uniref:Transcriptional regulator n=1 Tax=Fulvimarina pelagi HTCC2506 TaxID=314231 RepID=Q0G5K5_9HYPH|nr:FadR/GntR family transcriptional regulator [Fulvimarina pelagi]EAU43059.1 transcriptional regulator [Fulvimarina pelagi HTCC2506]
MSSPARKTSRTADLASEYGRRITSGILKPGDNLPVEAQLAAEWGVSRTVVREAMRLLAAKGLLRVGPKVGTRVLSFDEWNMLDPDVMAWHLLADERRTFVDALYEMRLINEPVAARMAAARIGATDKKRLSEALEAMGRHPRGSDELIAADLAFHRIILEATGNPILRSLGAMIEKSLSISFSLSWRQNPQEETLQQHKRVSDAIIAGDGEAAELFMRRLIESAFDDVTTALYAEDQNRKGRHETKPDRKRAGGKPVSAPVAGT